MAVEYRDWAPSTFDRKGLGLPDRQDWIVAPCLQTRDSGPREQSNFAVQEKILAEKGACEIHRFGHWGPGWVEILLCEPALADEVDAIGDALAYYPVLDDSDLSERESEQENLEWDKYAVRALFRKRESRCHWYYELSDASIAWLADKERGAWLRNELDVIWEEGAGFSWNGGAQPERDRLARFIREQRKREQRKREQERPTHWIVGAGQVGCLYDYGPEACEAKQDAIETAEWWLDGANSEGEIPEEAYAAMKADLEQAGIHWFPTKIRAIVGADYIEISEQDGPCPGEGD